MGITPQLAAGAWVGCEDRSVHFESLRTGGGSNSGLPIFAMFLQKVHADPSLHISGTATFEAPLNMRAVNLDCSAYEESENKGQRKRLGDDEFF
jgi:penicillin-binding protein 1A